MAVIKPKRYESRGQYAYDAYLLSNTTLALLPLFPTTIRDECPAVVVQEAAQLYEYADMAYSVEGVDADAFKLRLEYGERALNMLNAIGGSIERCFGFLRAVRPEWVDNETGEVMTFDIVQHRFESVCNQMAKLLSEIRMTLNSHMSSWARMEVAIDESGTKRTIYGFPKNDRVDPT